MRADGIEVESNCVGRGTTAPEMMLLPYMSEPATGSRMASMSTGGAAMKATMKQIVVANRVGIIRTEPTDIETVIGGCYPLAEIVPRG